MGNLPESTLQQPITAFAEKKKKKKRVKLRAYVARVYGDTQ